MIKKILKTVGITLLSLISLFIVVVLVLASFEKQIYNNFYSRVEESVLIPGLDTTFVPQGLEYVEEQEVFLMSGYMNGGGASRIYVSSKDSSYKYVELKHNNENFEGHVGGVSSSGDNVYVASDDAVYILSLADVLNASDGGAVNILSSVLVDLVPAFTTVYDGYLYVGEFYRKDKYDTDPAHHLTVNENEMNYALCYAYKLDAQGSTDFVPEFIISIPNQVQGLCFSENKLFISTSWAISDSHLMIYENWKTNPIKYESKDSTTEIDLYVLNDNLLTEDVHMPPMSEEVDYIDGKVYISFESAGKKYKSINVFRQENVLAFDATR